MKRALIALVLGCCALGGVVAEVPAELVNRGSSLSSGRNRPSITADFGASISNLFGHVRWEWGGKRDPATERPRKTSFFSRPLFGERKSAPPRKSVFAAAKNKLAVVETGGHAGTGFLVRDGGRVWLYTNGHVVRNQPYVKATMLDGTQLRLGAREYAYGLDLARLAVVGQFPALELRADLPNVGEHITVLGNSDGRGVITELRGRILGVGPTEIEIDATFTQGNSGSPVIDAEGRVLAVATYLRNCRNDADWSKRNTRFNGIRRFALRLTGAKWEPAKK